MNQFPFFHANRFSFFMAGGEWFHGFMQMEKEIKRNK